MFYKSINSLDQAAKTFLVSKIQEIRELVRKYGKAQFANACQKILKNPFAITRWLAPSQNPFPENAAQLTDEDYLCRQYLILTALHDDYIDRDVPPIYFTDVIKQNKKTAEIFHLVNFKYYTAFRDTERLATEAYITDALKAVEADLTKSSSKVEEIKNKPDIENIAVDDDELTILTELNAEQVQTLGRKKLYAITGIKDGTLKDKLRRLENIDLVSRPLGERKGYRITDKGREVVKKSLS
jgi:hypothetical protein